MHASPVGVVRALEWTVGAFGRAGSTPLHLVVNQAPRGRFRQEEIRSEITRTITPTTIAWCPHDRAVERAAWDGTPTRRGAFHAACATVAGAIAPAPQTRRRRRIAMTVDAYDAIRREVHVRIERRRLRPEVDLDEVRGRGRRDASTTTNARRMLGAHLPLADPSDMADRVLRSITDLGPLTELLARRDVEEIFIEGPRVSYLDGSGRLRGLAVPTSEDENRQIVERLLAATDRQLNTKHPMVQARVLDGTARLTAAIPPVGDQLSATLRRYVVRNVTLDDLVARDVALAPGGGVPPSADAAPQPDRGLG